MIVHMALFSWKKSTSKEQIDRIMSEIIELKSKCKGVIEPMGGENFCKHSKGFTHGVVVIVKDRKALDNYRNCKAHQKIAKIVDKMAEDGIGLDFQTKL